MILFKKLFRSKVLKNGLWLTALQIFNTIAPMLTIPYITRVLGASKYGNFSIALNLIYYIQVIVEYGFAMSGSRKIALQKDENSISEIYSAIFFSRLLLMIVSLVIIISFAVFGNYNKVTIICMLLLSLIVIGTTIQLTWLFQGMQDMKPITIVSIISRTVSLILIFVLVKSERDLFLYCILYASTNLIYGLIGQLIGRKKYHIHLINVTFSRVLDELKDGWYLFTSSAMSKIFGNIGVTILGLIATEYYVGVYSAISKITSVAILMFLPISQALFPHVSQLYIKSEVDAYKIVKKIGFIVVGVFSVGSFIVILFRDFVVKMAFGAEYEQYSLLLLPLVIWMIASIINNFLGIQTLVASGRQKQYSHAFMFSMFFLVVYNLIFVNLFEMYGVAIAQAASELTLTLFLLFTISKRERIEN